jgi:hypothetical protein
MPTVLSFKLRSTVLREGPTHLPIGDNRRAEDERLTAELLDALGNDIAHLTVVVVARRGVRVRHRHDDDRLAEVLLLPADCAEHRTGGGAVRMVLPVLLVGNAGSHPPSFPPHGECSRAKQSHTLC